MKRIVCIGGGAASFFFAANVASAVSGAEVIILEQGRDVLSKVRISGGGRCNVTHNCLDPDDLVLNYPRGAKELLGPFHEFGPRETIDWFSAWGVDLKTEEDGRMFPVTDRSETIIECLTGACRKAGVRVRTSAKVKNLIPEPDGGYRIALLDGSELRADIVFVAPGGSKQMWQVLEHLGHTIVPPIPSLFTFQISDRRIHGLSGVSVPWAIVSIPSVGIRAEGPLLVTHRGLSGPAILKLSAFGARDLAAVDYRFELGVDWVPDIADVDIRSWREEFGKKLLGNHQMAGLPKRLYQALLDNSGLDLQKKMASTSNRELDLLTEILKNCTFHVNGQNRFKEEFVTAGGVDLSEINMKSFGSKVLSNVYMAGEVLNIDAVTGGFNFQAAWTGASLAARDVARRFQSK